MNTTRLLAKLGLIEGLSLLLLISVAMPLKYLAGNPLPVRIGGMLHGLLFVAYVGVLLLTARQRRWPLTTILIGVVVSTLPFGFWLSDDYLPADDSGPAESNPLSA